MSDVTAAFEYIKNPGNGRDCAENACSPQTPAKAAVAATTTAGAR
jgi:hypothetical protein